MTGESFISQEEQRALVGGGNVGGLGRRIEKIKFHLSIDQ